MEWTSAFPALTPTTKQLLVLSQWSGANNNIGLDTSLDWKSDLCGNWLRGVQQQYRRLNTLNQALPKNSIVALSAGMTQQWMQSFVFEPIRDKAQQAVLKHTDPDLFQQRNIDIETQYAELTGELCQQCFEDNKFSAVRAARIFTDPLQSQQFYFRLAKMSALEYQYNSLGLTRLTAQKELLTSLLILITGTPATDPQPYRHYDDNNQPLDSFNEYLAKCQLRLETLNQLHAFDPVYFSEHSPAATLGCCDFSVVRHSSWQGVQLRYYPCQQKIADKNPIIYLSSPLINRAEIFDLAPGKSVIEGLLSNGYHVYLVDYSQAGDQDTGQGLDFFGKQIHDRYLDLVLQAHPKQQIHAMGYCMGGTLFLAYLARRAEERQAHGLPMDITKLVLMATPVLFDDANSGHGPMRDLIRNSYDAEMISQMFDGVNIPPQLIEAGMHKIQPGIRYTISRGFYERASFEGAIEDAAPFLNWLSHGTRFPVRAHQEWIENIFTNNQIWKGEYCLSSSIPALDGKPVNMHALTRAGVQIMDYRGLRDPISPAGSCIASETWGVDHGGNSQTTDGLNRTIEKNIGHIFVVSRKLLAEYLEHALHFYQSKG
ncbi:alpha/beta fold hydrolase [Neptunomonas antarctica]|uniref:Alpha/beta hydrolase fold n=1 Tax=Neptunomonas antarctica TaxID=619304 RepID=A0A1N7L5N2_9GAMM|nr:alpha/beta fold hydrolase [Neptunomonas antarctica]SIS69101.1 alpha/beta hydrolase fold [Neptunomonas antarctica]